jgi:hypothetical protein
MEIINWKNVSWKSTGLGLTLIATGAARGYLAYRTGQINEESITTTTTAVLAGIGMILGNGKRE